MCNPSVFLFLWRFMTAPPTLLPKQMQASHLCPPPAVNTHTQGIRLTCANTFTLPRRLQVPREQLHQQQGPLAVATVQNIPVAPSGLHQPAPPAFTTQCPSQLPSTGVDRKQEEEEEEEKLFPPSTIQEAAGEVRLTTSNHSFNFNLLRQTQNHHSALDGFLIIPQIQ